MRKPFARRRRPDRDGERGSSTAEFVIVLPLFALLVLGMIQYAADVHGQQAAQAAASLALATAREQTGTASAGQAAANSELAQLTTAIQDPTVDVERTATEVVVTVSGEATGILGIHEHVAVTAAGPVDRFTSNTETGS